MLSVSSKKRLFDLKNQLSRSSNMHNHKRLGENLQQYLNVCGSHKNDYPMLQTLLAHCLKIIKGPNGPLNT